MVGSPLGLCPYWLRLSAKRSYDGFLYGFASYVFCQSQLLGILWCLQFEFRGEIVIRLFLFIFVSTESFMGRLFVLM